jgi:1-acyl-sn-glycerol-3-phosphate acyltransferase
VARFGAVTSAAALRPDVRASFAPRRRAERLASLARAVASVHGIDLWVGGRVPVGPVVLAANHVSYLDPVAVCCAVPCVPVSKAEVAGWPLVGAVARKLGVIFHQRASTEDALRVMRDARKALEQGLAVLNFPEGTTTRGDEVLPFRPGMFSVARACGAPVVPVALAYEPAHLAWVGDDTFLPHYLRMAGERRIVIRMRFGEPMDARAFAGAAALAQAARERVDVLRATLRAEPAGAPGRRTPPDRGAARDTGTGG